MKKIFLLSLFICLLASCTNEIGPIPNDEPQKLIINALMNAGKTENAIYLNLSDYNSPQIVKNGIIRLYINGELSETITECIHPSEDEIYTSYEDYYYKVHSTFNSGDHIRIKAETSDGKFRAEAETIVHEPIRILQLDTLHRTGSLTGNNLSNGSLWLSEYTRLKIKLEIPSNSQMQYYRVQFKEDYTYYLVNRETRKDSIITNTYWGVSQYYDTALMDGKPGSSNDFDSNIEFVPPIQNYYRVFSSAYFSNRQYTMILETAPTYPWDTENYEIKKTTCYATLQYYAISSNEYRYLLAASAYNDHDNSNPLEIPVIFPNNIKGGIGIFAIESPTEYKFELKR